MCRISCARRVKKFKAKAWNLIITLFMIRRRRTRRIDPKTPQVRHSDEMKYIKKYTIFLSKSQFLLASDNYYWMFMNRRIFFLSLLALIAAGKKVVNILEWQQRLKNIFKYCCEKILKWLLILSLLKNIFFLPNNGKFSKVVSSFHAI